MSIATITVYIALGAAIGFGVLAVAYMVAVRA